jgi:hypothetical protein
MNDLLEAIKIFLKYSQAEYPTNCNHDELRVMVDPAIVSAEDIARLEELGFTPDEYDITDTFISHRFGSC